MLLIGNYEVDRKVGGIEISVLTLLSHENGDNHAVHTENTGHDDRNDRFEEEVGLEHCHGDNTDTGLGSAVGRSKVGKDESSSDAHRTEENGLIGVTVNYKKGQ